MRKQFLDALLIVLTAAAVICAGLNFQQQRKVRIPVDGVTWVERPTGVVALHVQPGSPGANAGIKAGDELREIDGHPIRSAVDATAELLRAGGWSKVKYTLRRNLVELEAPVIVGVRDPGLVIYYQYLIGAGYLFIGLFVYLRRARAKRALHFYLLCLSSFVLFTFHYTGKLNDFDQFVYWMNVLAGLLAPTLFLHFCLKFPAPPAWFRGALRRSLIYVPGAALFVLYAGFATGALRVGGISPVEVRWVLDRLWLPMLSAYYIAGAAVLAWRYREVKNTVARQQMKWLRNGALFGIVPFAVLYVAPYSLGVIPTHSMELSVFSMALIPVTWSYAILRYRLMDVDIIFQQGYVYTVSTLLVIGIVYGLVFALGDFETLSPTAIVLLVLIAAFVFQPIRDWVRDQFDRYLFYKDHYDYRRTLIEFGRELSSETDLDTTFAVIADRLMRTLSIRQSAFFLARESGGFELDCAYRLAGTHSERVERPKGLDLSFLPSAPQQSYLFFEQTRNALDIFSRQLPASVREAIASLDLTYYLPCVVRGKAIAYLGVSRTQKDDFLTSEDLELLTTLCGYVGIAVENAKLYRSLNAKVEEYERLKEFNENIVESINVGIVAVGLDGGLEGWNAQMEKLTGLTRAQALNRKFRDIFPQELATQIEENRSELGVSHFYKYPLQIPALPVNGNGAHAAYAAASNGMEPAHNGTSAETRTAVAEQVREAEKPAAGREATVNIAVAPLVTKDFHCIGHLIIFDDVTERTQLERQLVQADKLSSIGLLAAGVAHEVNTPLAVISTYAQMLAKQVSGDERQAALLEKITKQTFRASEIVNSLLNFSRTSTTEFEKLDLNQLVRDTLFLIEPQLEKAGIRRELELADDTGLIRGNNGRLQQVFLNLFLNARDAMESGGTLRVTTWSRENSILVEVADTGSGIPAEFLDRIYDPFFTTKGARKGTGLGLAVSYGIVQEHGGTINVETAPSRGTRFLLEFPAIRA